MLVLSRKQDQDIIIGDNIKIKILKVKGNTIRIGIEAPRDVKVIRGELPAKNSGRLTTGGSVKSDSKADVERTGDIQAAERSNDVSEANVTIVFSSCGPSKSEKIAGNSNQPAIANQNAPQPFPVRRAVGSDGPSRSGLSSSNSQPTALNSTNSSISFRQPLPAALQHNRLKELVKQLTRDN